MVALLGGLSSTKGSRLMADNTLTSAASLLFEMQGTMQELFPKDYVFLAELSGVQKGNPPSSTFDSMVANGRITQEDSPGSFYRDPY